MKFYEQYQYNFQFLILDSSTDRETEEIRFFFQKKNVKHIKYDSSIFFAHKISDGSKFIDTKFAVLCPDDDYLIPSGIFEARNYLDENSNYSSAHGFQFSHTSASISKKEGFSINPIYKNGSISESDSPLKRVGGYFSGLTGFYPFYAVHRTNLFQLIWSEAEIYISDWGLSELFPCALSFIYGKMKVLPIFYSSREPNTFQWYNKKKHDMMYSNEKVEKAISGIAKHLSIKESISFKESHNATSEFLAKYMNKAKNKFSVHTETNSMMLSSFKARIKLRTRIRKIFYNGCHPTVYKNYYDDFLKVKKSVINANLSDEKLNSSRLEYAN